MTLLGATDSAGTGSLLAALGLGALGVWCLLPKPRPRAMAIGTFASLASLTIFAMWLSNRFGPVDRDKVGAFLFWLFAGAAITFSAVFVTQRNPARGAIAFAFVIVSVCGLFLLLAAPFLMAATLIIYAGAIIVTFLFVLMLSQTRLASDENDRTREPLLGTLAGFSFLGLTLFALLTSENAALPARPMLPAERTALLEAAAMMTDIPAERDAILKRVQDIRAQLAAGVGGLPERLALSTDASTASLRQQSLRLRNGAERTLLHVENRLMVSTFTSDDHVNVNADLRALADEVRLLAAHGELPARNVANLGYTLYSDYILAVELAGAALLAATIGAVLIAGRKAAAA